MPRVRHGVLGAAMGWCVVGFLLASCGSDSGSSGGNSKCGDVCNCVVSAGGDAKTCNDECTATINAGGNEKASCEAKLDAYGIPQCKPKCAAFPTG